jgi:hypothetical protein
MSKDINPIPAMLTPVRTWLLLDLDADPVNASEVELARTGTIQHALTLLMRMVDHIETRDDAIRFRLVDLPGRESVHVGTLNEVTGGLWRGRAFVRDMEFGLTLRRVGSLPDDTRMLQGTLEWGGYRQGFLIRCCRDEF